MQIKNRIIYIFILFITCCFVNINLYADEFDITAKEISIDKINEVLIGKGSVFVKDSDGTTIEADEVIYQKSNEFLKAIGSVIIKDPDNNILTTDEATYDKLNEIINTFEKSKINLTKGYKLSSDSINYSVKNKIMSSDKDSILTDIDGNIVELNMFQYQINKNLLSSIGNIKITDKEKNKYFLKEIHVDTKKNEMVGSNVNILLDTKGLNFDNENEPRFASNSIFLSENKSSMSKGIFTACKSRGKDKCPPWSLQAKEISHDKTKKTIYYDHAVLKLYNVPIFYFPKFFHPDPKVKRQSGFLMPSLSNSSRVGTGISTPYYWAINHDKDLTFTTKTFLNENPLFLNEYRQAFSKGFLTLDASHTKGHKTLSSKKTDGSRSHLFGELDLNLNDTSKLEMKVQRASNDTFFRTHDINTSLVDSSNTNMTNMIKYSFKKDNTFLDISSTVYEDLRKTSDRYEFILPNILYGKTFLTEEFGIVNFESNALYKNYEANKYQALLTNEIIWNPNDKISKNGFVNTLEGRVKNTNYESKNATDLKSNGIINELRSVLTYKSSLPLKKDGINFSKIFSPTFMFRYAPGHMRDLSKEDVFLNYTNAFSTNKTSMIEDGLSAVLGFNYKINDKNNSDREKVSISMAQVFNRKDMSKMPSRSSLDQKTSDLVGEIDYNFAEIGSIGYKFSLDHDFNSTNYNQISTNLNLGKVNFNVNYLEQRKHIGTEHYIQPKVTLNMNDNNTFSYASKKNFKTDSTELYDISYQYKIDCLTAGVVFRREFYQDSVSNQKESLLFKITFVPFGGEVKSKSKISK